MGPLDRALGSLRLDRVEAVGLSVLLVSATLATGVLWWASQPRPVGAPPGAQHATLVPSPPPAPDLLVHVSGAVGQPGVVRLAPGSRVLDALTAAGGPLGAAGLDALNLAREVADGERVHVPHPGESLPDHAPEGGEADAAGPLDLNRATAPQLEELPGIGPVLAERILTWRDQHGPFESVGQLRQVPGIGERTFQALAELVRV